MKLAGEDLAHLRVGSLPARGVWIEIGKACGNSPTATMSLPARGVWIEIFNLANGLIGVLSLPARGVWIEINPSRRITVIRRVAPRKGSVD